MATFSKSVVIDAPVESVFAFHERDDALELLAPAFPPMRVLSKTGGIKKGARVEMQIGPFRWIALHIAYEKNQLFVDEQVQGPFAQWVHRHVFEDLGVATRLTDHVEYRLPGGQAVNAVGAWAVKPGLYQMFSHRHRVTKRYCEGS